MEEFDVFAATYEESLDRSIRVTGDTFDYFAAYKASYIARRVAPKGFARILDYGCGVGLLSRHLRDILPGKRIDGFDPSVDSIARVDADLRSQGIFTSNLSEIGEDYSVIVIANVLHHVKPPERQNLIRDVASRVAVGGKLVIFEHNPLNPLTCWAVSQCPFDGDAVLLHAGETRGYFSVPEFRLRRDYIVFFPRWLGRLRPFEPFLAWCPLGAQYTVVATKAA
jgi:2-polyprenyl-3-methyl-5-hydroxy-6-metoxy-1,4-benzoquinol methylase